MANPLEQLINSLAPEKRAILATMLQPPPEPIAIIGMACRFPGGADSVEGFWDLLQQGRDAISEVPGERWDWREFYDPDPSAPDKMHTRWGGFLNDIAGFDAAFFGIGPDEARSMDPQQRLLLEVVWEALEHAGLAADRLARSQTGVFVGIINDDYPHFLMDGLGRSVCLNSPYFGIGSSSSMAGGRLSYTLDFRGPNVSLDTACSSSLVATHLACQALRNRECDLALAGGVHAILLPDVFINLCKMNMLANDGRCKTFDATANGFVMGEGCGMVVLRRLSDALKHGDPIIAVIRGTAVNEDGRSSSPTAPNGLAQQSVIRQALANAGVTPDQVQYVEAHGTGTPLGDPIELEALNTVLGAGRAADQPLLVSAVKTNIGHLAAAAGVAGLIKTALALQHGLIPASLNLRTPNPAIPWHSYNLAVATGPTRWPERPGPRIAGVSSFGWSGTNAHAVLEAAPERPPSGASRPEQLLLLSAKHPQALAEQAGRLGRFLAARPDLDLADVAYTLQVGRNSFAHRRALLCRSRDEALALLADAAKADPAGHVPADRRPLAFVLGGATEELAGLGRALMVQEPAFRTAVEQGSAALVPLLGRDLREWLYPEQLDRALIGPLHVAHAASAVLTHALAQLWRSWGLQPQLLLGDRLGECVAACLSGVLSLEDMLRVVVARARLIETLGQDQAAQHNAVLPPALAGQIRALLASVALRPPQIAYLSHISGAAVTPEQATDPAYWVRLFCEPDRFAVGLAALLAQPDLVLLEVGPGAILSAQVLAHPACPPERAALVVSSLGTGHNETGAVLAAAGQLWQAGVSLDWNLFCAAEQRRRVALPGYSFQRRRFWVDRAASKPQQAPAGKRAAVADWFYQAIWTPAALPAANGASAHWLVFAGAHGLGRLAVEHLRGAGERVIVVEPGARLARLSDSHFQIDPEQPGDYQAVLKQTGPTGPLRILHLWSLDPPAGATGAERFQAAQRAGYASLLLLVQALGQTLPGVAARVVVATNAMQAVDPQDIPAVEHATIPALCLVINQEHTNLRCHSVDLRLDDGDAALAEHLVQEARASGGSAAVAYRGSQRLVQGVAPLRLETGPSRLRPRGVYLITGGLGGVGLLLAEYLARSVQARLVLLGRAGLPAREQWDAWLAEHPASDPTSTRIRQVRLLEQHGAEVLVLRADVAELDQMEAAVAAAEERFGPLHGVLHAAGLTDQGGFAPAKSLTAAQCEAHFRPKAYGLYALEQALGDRPLDFCLLFSSLSAVLGGLGFGAYAAANAFMDAFAQRHSRSHPVAWTSVDWDAWRVQDDQAGRAGATLAQYEMLPDEGCAAFELVIGAGASGRIIQATGDLEQRLRQWVPDAAPSAAATSETARPPALSLPEYERLIAAIWGEVLGIEQVGLHDNFFDLGGNSLNGLQVIARLQQAFQVQLSNVALFEAPTVAALARLLRPPEQAAPAATPETRLQQRRAATRQTGGSQDIAIIAMAGRFPGAPGVEQLWQNLCDGVESITTLSEAELLAAGIDPLLIQNPQYVRAKPALADVDLFDPAFFGYTPREAELMDPQQRLFHECAWEALELAGYDTQRYPGLIGVFAGANLNFYMLHMATDPLLVGAITDNVVLENDKDALATNVAYRLNLRGPSFAVQTFCSTSLVAVHLACRSLLGGECDMALAGGVSVRVPVQEGYLYKPGDQVSPDGHCRTFDAQAEGTIFGDGVGLVVLKRLADALEDGDTIHAVIKGSAINNDGDLKVGYTAPSVVGQSEVIISALTQAAVDPATIGYVEAHGTATKLGDPIEVAALTKAYRSFTDRRQFCAISSVKPNVGHLDRAAGVTGLIKAAMVLKHGLIPPLLHFRQPNPEIDFDNSPFFVPAALLPWPEQSAPRRAAVNSLGVGGTNAHVIVEQPPEQAPSGPSREAQLLLLSARTPAALDAAARNLRDFLQAHPETPLADVAYTLQVGRRVFEHRRMLVARTNEEACRLLDSNDPARVFGRTQRPASRGVALLIGGMGEQYPGMGQDLYEHEPVFRECVDRCCAILAPLLGQDLRPLLYPDTPAPAAPAAKPDLRAMLGRGAAAPAGPLQQTALAHPALFVTSYALAELLRSWGIQPKALLGYSLGEYVAACLSGVFSLEDALQIVAARARLIQDQPAGAMLAVALGQAQLAPYLGGGLSLAATNSPSTCVVAGTPEAITALHNRLTAAGVSARRVETDHAFHSPLLAPAAPELAALIARVPLRPPQIPYLSNVTGTWITAEQATDPDYWARHLCQPVRFADGVAALLAQPDLVLLELGPGQNLGSFVRQHPDCTRERMSTVLGALRGRNEVQGDLPTLLTALGKLWLLDVPVDWDGFVVNEQRRRVPLPTYPFERQRYWLAAQPHRNGTGTGSPQRRPDPGDWFCVPSWKRTSLPAETGALAAGEPACWLVFSDSCGVGEQLASRLAQQGHTVVRVVPGAAFRRTGPDHFCLRPGQAEDYAALLRELAREQRLPDEIAHCWMVTPPRLPAEDGPDALPGLLDDGFYSLIGLAQALGNQDVARCRIQIVSSNMQDVTGSEPVDPFKATLLGPAKVIPQEYRAIGCRSIDIELPPGGGLPAPRLLDNLLAELTCTDSASTLALRGPHRWVQVYEPVYLPPVERHPRLRPGGVYLITGGLGGIGLALAGHLAETLGARLALLGRTALPPEDQWDHILATEDPEQGVARQIRLVRGLRARTEVLLLQADVADEVQVRRAVAQTIERFGALHGVLHAAGVPGVGLIQLKNRAAAEAVLAPKLQGTLALSHALRDIPLDLLVLFSSVATATGGGPGQVDYCAANAFLESYARCNPLRHGQTVAIGWGEWRWDAWQAGLQGYPAAAREYLAASRRAYGLGFDEGAEALRRVLASQLSSVYVTTQELQTLVAHSQGALLDNLLGRSPDQDQERTRYPRPTLGTSYVQPRNPTETTLVEIWSAVLGIEQVGIHDSFFELGGNSLVGVELVARIRRALALESLPNHVLYEAPSVAALAAFIANQGQHTLEEEDDTELEDRGERRRAQLGMLNRRPQVEEEDIA